MNTISDIANKSNRKLYMNHLSSLAKLREARLRIEELEAVLRTIANGVRDADKSYVSLFHELQFEAREALGEKKDEN